MVDIIMKFTSKMFSLSLETYRLENTIFELLQLTLTLKKKNKKKTLRTVLIDKVLLPQGCRAPFMR